MEEIKKIAKVLYNKIRNENIKYVEELAYHNQEYRSHVLEEYAISTLDIEKAIENKEDLNQIYTYSLQNYINVDLNAFFSFVTMVRSMGLNSFVDDILKKSNFDMEMQFSWIPNVLECFTYEEGLQIKRAFLTVMTNFTDIFSLSNETIDQFYSTIMSSLEESAKKTLHF